MSDAEATNIPISNPEAYLFSMLHRVLPCCVFSACFGEEVHELLLLLQVKRLSAYVAIAAVTCTFDLIWNEAYSFECLLFVRCLPFWCELLIVVIYYLCSKVQVAEPVDCVFFEIRMLRKINRISKCLSRAFIVVTAQLDLLW